MDQQIPKITPNYKQIYKDILNEKFPEKKDILNKIVTMNNISSIDVIKINQNIFGGADSIKISDNQKHRSYKKGDILQILDYQKKHKLTNSKVAERFKVSRNSISKWKKIFL